MKKFLFPFEIGNPIYREAYVYAVKLARNLHRELILLNAFILEVGNDINRDSYARMVRDNWIKAYNELSRYNKYYLENHSKTMEDLQIRFDHRFINGDFRDVVNSVASEDEVGTIILPLSGDKDFSRRQLEIIHENVLSKRGLSLLVLPEGNMYRPVRNMAFLTDLKYIPDLQRYLDEALDIALALDSGIHFLHYAKKSTPEDHAASESYRIIRQITATYKHHIYREISGDTLLESVERYAAENDVDMLVVVKQQQDLLDTLLRRSVSDKLSLKARIPVWVMHEQKE